MDAMGRIYWVGLIPSSSAALKVEWVSLSAKDTANRRLFQSYGGWEYRAQIVVCSVLDLGMRSLFGLTQEGWLSSKEFVGKQTVQAFILIFWWGGGEGP